MRANYSHNVVARRLFVVRRSFSPSFSSSYYPPPLPISSVYFYSSGASGSFPLVYRLRALVLRDVTLSINMTDAAVISFLSPPFFFPFSFELSFIFIPLHTCLCTQLV